jgi:hypothetical protein
MNIKLFGKTLELCTTFDELCPLLNLGNCLKLTLSKRPHMPLTGSDKGGKQNLGPREVLLGLWGGDPYFFPGVCWMLFVSDHNSYTPFAPNVKSCQVGPKLPRQEILSILEFRYVVFSNDPVTIPICSVLKLKMCE